MEKRTVVLTSRSSIYFLDLESLLFLVEQLLDRLLAKC